jgi:serine/threonine protein kinase
MADRVGQQLGNYKLIKLLGQGGFADVYLGEHIYLNTMVAVKVLHTQLASDGIEEFLTESRTIARLVHPNIIRVLDFGVMDNIPFLVMDYAPNGTLRQHHPKGVRVPLPTVVLYVKQVAVALRYTHEQKLIHRDIKPENMLLGQHNDILLSDFGIASVAQSSHYQITQEVVGTAAYMAPEQLQGKARQASDQYALGVVVYEWLCGERPFQGSFTEIVSQHLWWYQKSRQF